MDNRKDDKYFIRKIVENIDAIILYTKDISYDDFVSDSKLIDATMFRLIQMGENINRLSLEYKTKHNNIQWGLIVGFRNGIVHEYGKTDYTIVYDIITKDIFDLKNNLLFEN